MVTRTGHTRVFFNLRRLTFGSRLASIFIPRSLADFAFRHPTSFRFSIYFLTSMCQYRRLISSLHAFATSHHASYFGSREIGSVQKESTRPHTLKTNHPLKPQLSHVYTMTLPLFRLRATFTYKHNYPPAYLCAALRTTCRASISPPFCVLGSWDSRGISFITPPPSMLPLSPICHAFLCSWFPNFFALCLFSDSFGGLAIYLLRRRPRIIFFLLRSWMFLPRALFSAPPRLPPSFFSLFHPCININSAHLAWTIASHHTHHFCAIAKVSPFQFLLMSMVRYWFSGV